MTSAVTSMPRFLAHRMMSTDPAVERWQTCRREPTCSASSTSRAMIDSSATAGHPASPSSAETAPSFICAPSVRRGSWACWAMTPSKAFTYSSARRMMSGSHTQKPSSLNTRTRARDDGHRAELREPLALLADRHRADGLHRGESRGLAERELLLDHPRRVGDRRRIGHGEDRRESAGGRGAGAGEDRLGDLVARLAQVRVQVDEAGKRDEPVGVDARGARAATGRFRPRRSGRPRRSDRWRRRPRCVRR